MDFLVWVRTVMIIFSQVINDVFSVVVKWQERMQVDEQIHFVSNAILALDKGWASIPICAMGCLLHLK